MTVASALVSALAAPLREVQALVGAGGPPDPALTDVRDALGTIAAAARRSWSDAGTGWWGVAADNAAQRAAETAAAADALAERADLLAARVRQAGAAVGWVRTRLQAIVDGFEHRANALEPRLDEPGVAEELLTEAHDALRDAIAVVEQLRAELDQHAAAITPVGSTAPTVPAGFSGGSGTPSGFGSGLGTSGLGLPSSPTGGIRAADFSSGPGAQEAALFGDGVAIRLPDGSSAMAPNGVAASAVRHALTQLGVPYHWGGTTPGVGLDCSGLTQWAYREAGLEIPRLAQEQDVGAAVAGNALRPGDLAVWDGHVAMVVGNGTMIEAGDPVQLSPIRTTNAGQGFHGFFRPTA